MEIILKWVALLLGAVAFYYLASNALVKLNTYSHLRFGRFFFTRKGLFACMCAGALIAYGYFGMRWFSFEAGLAVVVCGVFIGLLMCGFNIKATNASFGIGATVCAVLLSAVVTYLSFILSPLVFVALLITLKVERSLHVNNP